LEGETQKLDLSKTNIKKLTLTKEPIYFNEHNVYETNRASTVLPLPSTLVQFKLSGRHTPDAYLSLSDNLLNLIELDILSANLVFPVEPISAILFNLRSLTVNYGINHLYADRKLCVLTWLPLELRTLIINCNGNNFQMKLDAFPHALEKLNVQCHKLLHVDDFFDDLPEDLVTLTLNCEKWETGNNKYQKPTKILISPPDNLQHLAITVAVDYMLMLPSKLKVLELDSSDHKNHCTFVGNSPEKLVMASIKSLLNPQDILNGHAYLLLQKRGIIPKISTDKMTSAILQKLGFEDDFYHDTANITNGYHLPLFIIRTNINLQNCGLTPSVQSIVNNIILTKDDISQFKLTSESNFDALLAILQQTSLATEV
jgi:hypothetical protein